MDVLKLGGTEMINRTQTTLAIRRTVCVPVQRIDSEGIWLKDNPLDFPYPLMLFQIILLVLISRALYCLLRPLGQTKFVCNLLGGIILGPSLLGHNKALRDKLMFGGKEVGLSDTIARVGVIYSVFLISVKYDMATFKMKAKNGWKICLVGFLFPSAVTSSLVYTNATTISWPSGGTFFLLALTISLSFTYFPVVAEALDELNLMTSELGQLAMSSATINDIILWIFTVVHLIVIQRSINGGAKTLVSLLALILFTVFVIQPIIKWIVKRTPEGQEVKDGYVSAMQLMPLVMAFLSDIIGMRPEAGPILLGLVVPNGPPLGAALVQKTEFVVSEIFLPLFFFRVGLTVNVYSVDDWSSFRKLQLMLTMSYVAKIIAVTVIALCCKIRLRNAFLLSMMMSMKGLIELIVYDAWKAVKCTVGILVDRGMSCPLSSVHFSCNVALFFIGGADDREALAFTARMSGNPNVGMTVFRIALRSKLKERNEEEQVAAKLDESLVDEFRLRNIGNDRLDWREIEVDDSVQLMDAVMNSQGSYDLVIVGRRHADTTLRDEEMSEFVENAELGVIGDIVASSDFCGRQVNVLVIQESRELRYGAFRSGL
ncbi:unnamed protein product [Prunus armeniaca]|uniref:Uncharacterized protein n=1 Tax=Prunus armeniaca TaxID=36596 RepID=A0A6J5WM87_PRUAR|nr:unnamed protein product [Prunus armeniaca]